MPRLNDMECYKSAISAFDLHCYELDKVSFDLGLSFDRTCRICRRTSIEFVAICYVSSKNLLKSLDFFKYFRCWFLFISRKIWFVDRQANLDFNIPALDQALVAIWAMLRYTFFFVANFPNLSLFKISCWIVPHLCISAVVRHEMTGFGFFIFYSPQVVYYQFILGLVTDKSKSKAAAFVDLIHQKMLGSFSTCGYQVVVIFSGIRFYGSQWRCV